MLLESFLSYGGIRLSQLVLAVNRVLSLGCGELGISQRQIREEQIAIYSRQCFEEEFPDCKTAVGLYAARTGMIILVQRPDERMLVWDYIRALLHEALHATGHNSVGISQETGTVIVRRNGHLNETPLGVAGWGLNEAVVDDLARELIEKNLQLLCTLVPCADGIRFCGWGLHRYNIFVSAFRRICGHIGEMAGSDPRDVLATFRKANFTGLRCHLHELVRLYDSYAILVLESMGRYFSVMSYEELSEEASLVEQYFAAPTFGEREAIAERLLRTPEFSAF